MRSTMIENVMLPFMSESCTVAFAEIVLPDILVASAFLPSIVALVIDEPMY